MSPSPPARATRDEFDAAPAQLLEPPPAGTAGGSAVREPIPFAGVPSREMSAEFHAGAITIVDALDCDPSALRSIEALAGVFDELVRDLALHPLHAPVWERFPGPGGVTGFVLLRESHLACHTFPETGLATFDLYCCRARPAWDWSARLRALLGAREVSVRALARGASAPRDEEPTPARAGSERARSSP